MDSPAIGGMIGQRMAFECGNEGVDLGKEKRIRNEYPTPRRTEKENMNSGSAHAIADGYSNLAYASTKGMGEEGPIGAHVGRRGEGV